MNSTATPEPNKTGNPLDSCNVVWDTPSKNSSGSMPIGNGDIGMNVWVEENGDLLLLISKTDAWCENSRLLKLGRVRITLSPNLFAQGQPFRQELKLRDGCIEIRGGIPAEVLVRVWVDAHRPVIRVETEGAQPHDVTAKLELWRTEKRPFLDFEWFSCWHMSGVDMANRPKDADCFSMPDTVVDNSGDRVVWYHRNAYSVWPIGMKLQGLESVMGQFTDPLANRTFGAALGGKGFAKKDARTLQSSKPAKTHCLSIYPLTAQTKTPQAWLEQLDQSIKAVESVDLAKARAGHQQWWREFWERSWIRISGAEDGEKVARSYALQRWISACGSRGDYAIKFNGSIFTVEWREGDTVKSDPDYRSWGGDYWWQNTRLPYWPMLSSGDYDLMLPLFRMYFNTLGLAKARNRIWFDCDGAFVAETMSSWGMFSNGDYGWNRTGKPPAEMINGFIRWIWAGGPELAVMMLDYYDHTQDRKFLKDMALPWSDEMLLYFDTRFKCDANGKLIISPTQAVETYQIGVVNDTPDVAGLHVLIERLLSLPAELTDKSARQRWQRLQKEIPSLPMEERDGKRIVRPAETFEGRSNCENPEQYAIFPFRIYGVGKSDLETGRNTFAARIEKMFHGWQQSSIQAAYLGLAAEARSMLVTNATTKHEGSRFPAFWGPNFDWIPDQCHGGNILNATQTMLMQTEGRKIILFPAWPKEWNVEFKLHAPFNTTVEGVYSAGKVTRLTVIPPSRANDVEVMPAQ